MSKCELLSEYEKNLRKYLRHKYQTSEKSERDRKNRVKRFLLFCCKRGKKRTNEIEQNDFDKFVQIELEKYSTETKRKYRLALQEFFTRAKLPIKVNVVKSVEREKNKKLEKLKLILGNCAENNCIEKHKTEILKLF